VKTAKNPEALDPWEPMNLALAIAEMGLDYVVVTSVDRDDVEDGGAAHFAKCITDTRDKAPNTLVEVLIPDFRGNVDHLRKVVEARPEVIAHNIETIRRLTHPVRDKKATYDQSLKVLADIKAMDPSRYTKSSIMVGLGETPEEVSQCMRDLRDVDCDFLTIGQYLQPTKKHLKVDGFVHPDIFKAWETEGLAMGFKYVASGPLVRSSYKAGEYFITEFIQKQRDQQA
jgi:lipoic acid synthetase